MSSPDPAARALDALAADARHGETTPGVDVTAIRVHLATDRRTAETRHRAADRLDRAQPWLIAASLGSLAVMPFWRWVVLVPLAALVAWWLLALASTQPPVTTAAQRDTRVLAVACPRPECGAVVGQRCDVGFVSFQHAERSVRYATERARIEQTERP